MSYKIEDKTSSLPTHATKRYKRRALTSVTHLIVHHSATREGTAEAFARYHVQDRGYPGISYHYVIDKQGNVTKCQPASAISWHATVYNARSLGVCLVGNFDVEQPTAAQERALLELLKDLMVAYRVSPAHVLGHTEVPGTTKSCPGKNVNMKQIRALLGVG